MVPFESLGAVFYSFSIVTMALFLHQFRDKARYWSQIVIFSYPLAFGALIRAVPVGILPSRLVRKSTMVGLHTIPACDRQTDR